MSSDSAFDSVHRALQWDAIAQAAMYSYDPSTLTALHQCSTSETGVSPVFKPDEPAWAVLVMQHAERQGYPYQCGYVERVMTPAQLTADKYCDFYTGIRIVYGLANEGNSRFSATPAVVYSVDGQELHRWPLDSGYEHVGPPIPNFMPNSRVEVVGVAPDARIEVGCYFLTAGDSRALHNGNPSTLHLPDRGGVIWTFETTAQ